jgi:tRNA threonylcarbamoyladenosine biosynthesis protein TsaB
MSRLALAIETSTPVGSIAIGDSSAVLAEIVLGRGSRHSEQVLPAVDFALRVSGAARSDLTRVIVGGGPGSFTGLRIAAASAKGLAAALQLEAFAYSGLLAVAANTGIRERVICALFDARRDQLYAASFILGDELDTVRSPQVIAVDALLDAVDPTELAFAGEGAVKHEALIVARGGTVLPAHLGIPRASALLWLADRFPEHGRIADLRHWEPDYLRASGAERGVLG